MADEFTIDAKYKRDNLLAEHRRYQQALEEIADTTNPRRGFARWASERARQALNDVDPALTGPTHSRSTGQPNG